MKSPGRALVRALANPRNPSGPPIPLGGTSRYMRGLSFDLGAGKANRETHMRQYGMSGTIYGIVSLLAEASATPNWRLYKKTPIDGRRRYSTADTGSDQRTEVIQHAAIQLWNSPNDFHSGFEFREGSWQHAELTGETFWVLDTEAGFPTSMWYVRPDRMEPVPDPDDYLVGWYYTGPDGSTTPLKPGEVILEKRPDPLDPYRGLGPVAAIMPNIQQQRYATEYQRNLFLNGADPGGIITVPTQLTEAQFDELVDRWRTAHRGITRAGHVGVLEDGATYQPAGNSNKDMEYGELRLANRDELREAWRIHKAMMGSSDDVNRANAQTAQEVFIAWQVLPRLNRRRDTLNSKLLPLFGRADKTLEFDYDDPSPVNAENAAAELLSKAQAFAALIAAGADFHDALEEVGLPDMQQAATPPPVAAPAAPERPALPPGHDDATAPSARERITIRAAATGQPDLSAVDQQWRAATAQLATQYQQQIIPAQQRQITDQVQQIVATGALAALASLAIGSATGAALILTAMTAYANTAAKTAAAELAAQGATGAPPVAPPPAQLEQAATVIAAILAAELALAAGREAARYAATGATPEQVAQHTAAYMQSLSTAGMQAHLSGAMSAAQNKARLATFTSPAAPRAMLTATEMHDKNVCDPCDLINGHEFGYSDNPDAVASAHAAYPVGGYIECKGEDRCRGTLFAVMQVAPAKTPTTGELGALLRKVLSDGWLPIETGGTYARR